MRITEERLRLLGGMYEYISGIVSAALQKNKKLIIWGAGKGGAFLTHLIRDVDGRMDVSCYIDEHIVVPAGKHEPEIFRSSLLWYVPKEEYMVLLSIPKDEQVISFLEGLSYVRDEDYYDVRGDIGGSYLEYLSRKNGLLDFSYVTKEDRPDLYGGEYFESKPFDHSSIDRVFEAIYELPCEKTLFDIGCGKGQILLMAAVTGIGILGGIDFNSEIAEKARDNLKTLGIEAEIVCGDATGFEDLDRYSIFFLYNPFGEGSIRRVVENIRKSWMRRERDIFLVYGNPFYHMTVMEGGDVSLYKQVRVDLHDPFLNIYRIGG